GPVGPRHHWRRMGPSQTGLRRGQEPEPARLDRRRLRISGAGRRDRPVRDVAAAVGGDRRPALGDGRIGGRCPRRSVVAVKRLLESIAFVTAIVSVTACVADPPGRPAGSGGVSGSGGSSIGTGGHAGTGGTPLNGGAGGTGSGGVTGTG